MKKFLTLIALALTGAFGCAAVAQTASAAAQQPQPILLWPNGAPGAKGTAVSDEPAITVYLPAQNPTRTGIVVCPGGGYLHLATDWEGTKVAAWLNARGVAASLAAHREDTATDRRMAAGCADGLRFWASSRIQRPFPHRKHHSWRRLFMDLVDRIGAVRRCPEQCPLSQGIG